MEQPIAEVAVPRPLERTFDYRIPEHLSGLLPGVRVRVPFGRDQVVGYVLQRKAHSAFGGKLQPLIDCLDDAPLLSPAALALAHWMVQYYVCPLGLVLQAMLPQRLHPSRPSRNKQVVVARPLPQTLGAIEQLRGVAPQQARLLKTLLGYDNLTVRELLDLTGCSYGPLRGLLLKGWVELQSKPLCGVENRFHERPKALTLNGAQQAAVDAITAAIGRGEGTFLLHGVNGSGKTEVYLNAVRMALETDKMALVLVPEISLTPQLLSRFRSRFGQRLAVLHSALTEAGRAREWSRLCQGEARVVLGVRSASLVPLERLGLIVIDEEHEPSYKQASPEPRYHARTVALQRGKLEGAVVLLGSATPSLETFWRCETGQIQRLSLPERVVSAPAPRVRLVDMNAVHGWLSPVLERALADTLQAKKQAMLLLNRRGYGVAFCKPCQHTQRCPRCGIVLVFHLKQAQLRCHYCNYVSPHTSCERCGAAFELIGAGTQRVETKLKRLFPSTCVERMDSDTVRRGAHAALLERFRSGQIELLLGTQMIGVGHDFPGVGLMGIVDADTLLSVPDFRAAERSFQLLAQAAGRAGRGEQRAEVIVQTHHPQHYIVQHALRNDYEAFAKEELAFRKAHRYPPYATLIRVSLRHKNEDSALQQALKLQAALADVACDVVGPSKGLPFRWRGRCRWELLLKTEDPKLVKPALLERVKQLGLDKSATLNVDP